MAFPGSAAPLTGLLQESEAACLKPPGALLIKVQANRAVRLASRLGHQASLQDSFKVSVQC